MEHWFRVRVGATILFSIALCGAIQRMASTNNPYIGWGIVVSVVVIGAMLYSIYEHYRRNYQ
jgi:hypothetical protein